MVLVYIPSFAAPSRICRGLESPPSLLFYSAALRLIMDFQVFGHEGYNSINLTIYNMVRWFASSLGQMTRQPLHFSSIQLLCV